MAAPVSKYTCSICFENLNQGFGVQHEGEQHLETKTIHAFCRTCIDDWLSRSAGHLCPLCNRRVVNLQNLHELAFDAARGNQSEEVMKLVDSGVISDDLQPTLFLTAAYSGDIQILEDLLKRGVVPPEIQETGLHNAIYYNQPAAVEWILKHCKILPEILRREFQTEAAVGNQANIDLFLHCEQLSPEFLREVFLDAAFDGSLTYLQRFSSLRKDLISPDLLKEALAAAAAGGQQHCVEFLLTLKS
jgi:hypothetical protein